MSQPIVFYDILHEVNGVRRGWSINTWKSRLLLNFKRIPYTTVWVEFADIQTLSKEIGAPPTRDKPNGEPHHTLPALRDPSTGVVVADSAKIAQYLEAQYPERTVVPPGGTIEEQIALADKVYGIVALDFLAIAVPPIYQRMSAHSRPTFDYAVRLYDNGPALSERSPPTAEHLARVRDCLSRVAQLYGDNKYIAGEQVTYGDLMVAATLNMLMTVLKDEEKEQVYESDDGRWKAMIEEFEDAGYTKTDRGEVYLPQ